MGRLYNHPVFGKGEIIATRYQGFESLVKFENGIEIWVKSQHLTGLDGSPAVGITPPTTQIGTPSTGIDRAAELLARIRGGREEPKQPEITKEPPIIEISPSISLPSISGPITEPPDFNEFQARTIIEALRLGGVPLNLADRFSAGRDDEKERIKSFFKNEKGVALIKGEYGIGKTHLLEIIRSMALNKKYIVSKIEIDPNENSFHRPKKIYQSLIQGFSYPKNGHIYGFREFIDDVINSSNPIPFRELASHPYLGELIAHWKQKEGNDDLLEWIEARDDGNNQLFISDDSDSMFVTHIKLPRLYDYQNTANIYCNIISGIGWAARNVLDLSGLIILIDEAEGIDQTLYSSYQFQRAANLLKGFILMANNDKNLLNEPNGHLSEINYTFSGPNLCGDYTRLLYSKKERKTSPYLWKRQSYIKIVFSFIPFLLESLQMTSGLEGAFDNLETIELEELSDQEYLTLYHTICDFYQKAYGFNPPKEFYEAIPRDKTRLFVKGVVEGLDLMRTYPNWNPEQLISHD